MCFLENDSQSYIYSPSMSESERQKLASQMDMRPISEEYELELK